MYERVYRGISYAIEVAQGSNCPTYKVGAVLMKGNRLVAAGANLYRKTSPHTTNFTRCPHAEFRCSNNQKLKGLSIYVARVRLNGSVGMARPCADCLKYLVDGGIREIWFTNHSGLPERLALH